MSTRNVKLHVETQHVGHPGCWAEWAITARVSLDFAEDGSHELDEWLIATRVRNRLHPESFCSQCGESQGPNECGFSSCKDHAAPTSMDAEDFFALATDVDPQKITDDIVQQAIDEYDPTDAELERYHSTGTGRTHRVGYREMA